METKPKPQRVRVAIATSDEPVPVAARDMLPGKPYRYPRTPESYYERSQLTVAGFVKALRAEPKARDSRDEFMLGEANRIADGMMLTRVTRWQTADSKRERRDYILVDAGTEFYELTPTANYVPSEPTRFTLPRTEPALEATTDV